MLMFVFLFLSWPGRRLSGAERMDLQARFLPQRRAGTAARPQAQDQPARSTGKDWGSSRGGNRRSRGNCCGRRWWWRRPGPANRIKVCIRLPCCRRSVFFFQVLLYDTSYRVQLTDEICWKKEVAFVFPNHEHSPCWHAAPIFLPLYVLIVWKKKANVWSIDSLPGTTPLYQYIMWKQKKTTSSGDRKNNIDRNVIQNSCWKLKLGVFCERYYSLYVFASPPKCTKVCNLFFHEVAAMAAAC